MGRKRSGGAENVVDVLAMLPWWVGVVLAVVSYWLLHRYAVSPIGADPRAMASAAVMKGLATAGQYLVPGLCLAGAALSALRRWQRKGLADQVAAGTGADVLEAMTWREFEMLVGEAFRLKGYRIEESGGRGADGGIDLVLRKSGKKFLVQCKQWRSYKVGVGVIREHFGVMTAEKADGGIVVTSGRFTAEARVFAKGFHIELIEGEALFQMIKEARAASVGETDARPAQGQAPQLSAELSTAVVHAAGPTEAAPICPNCSSAMVRRIARRGANAGNSFWGCSDYPRCRSTAS
ncbi:restriction endonuclease [Variovorax sp. LjRoot290]|uniref:restriction endonuclease n=1 Tax=Variovorax sp. LjRoot290 TaxID=3342316 RepID=UPI003ECCB6DB